MIGQVKQGSTVKATYRWSPTGAKLSARTSAGDGYDYLGSLVYKMVDGQLQLESGSFRSGRIIATSNGFKPHYFITDHLGSVRVMWDGATAERSDYYPFGGRWTSAETQANTSRYLYNGKESQEDLGLSYLDYGARMYDARIGRWHTIDPMAEFMTNISLYAYCYNNPNNFIDRFGLFGQKPDFGVYQIGEVTVIGGNLYEEIRGSISLFINTLNNVVDRMAKESSYEIGRLNHEAEMRAYAKAMGESIMRLEREYDMLNRNQVPITSNIDLEHYIGPGLVLSGQKLIRKPFAALGSGNYTSVASKLTRNIPGKLPFRFLGTRGLGAAIGRAIPYLGWGITGLDFLNSILETPNVTPAYSDPFTPPEMQRDNTRVIQYPNF